MIQDELERNVETKYIGVGLVNLFRAFYILRLGFSLVDTYLYYCMGCLAHLCQLGDVHYGSRYNTEHDTNHAQGQVRMEKNKVSFKEDLKLSRDVIKATRKAKKLMMRFCYPCQLKLISTKEQLVKLKDKIENSGIQQSTTWAAFDATYDELCDECKAKYDEAMKSD